MDPSTNSEYLSTKLSMSLLLGNGSNPTKPIDHRNESNSFVFRSLTLRNVGGNLDGDRRVITFPENSGVEV
jgi:hypothetical protein